MSVESQVPAEPTTDAGTQWRGVALLAVAEAVVLTAGREPPGSARVAVAITVATVGLLVTFRGARFRAAARGHGFFAAFGITLLLAMATGFAARLVEEFIVPLLAS